MSKGQWKNYGRTLQEFLLEGLAKPGTQIELKNYNTIARYREEGDGDQGTVTVYLMRDIAFETVLRVKDSVLEADRVTDTVVRFDGKNLTLGEDAEVIG